MSTKPFPPVISEIDQLMTDFTKELRKYQGLRIEFHQSQVEIDQMVAYINRRWPEMTADQIEKWDFIPPRLKAWNAFQSLRAEQDKQLLDRESENELAAG